MYNKVIKEKFNKFSNSYDLHAVVQSTMAADLTRILKDFVLISNYDVSRVFEAGCGTGGFSRLLSQTIKPRHLILNDICKNMLAAARSKISDNQHASVDFIEADFEEFEFSDTYNIVTANAVFQWFRDLETVFNRIFSSLADQGILAFSIFTDGTFFELQESFKRAYLDLGLDYENHILQFYKKDVIKEMLDKAGFNVIKLLHKDYTLFYDNAFLFLKSVQQIGASGFDGHFTNYKVMRKMMRYYDSLKTINDGRVPATYKVMFCLAIK